MAKKKGRKQILELYLAIIIKFAKELTNLQKNARKFKEKNNLVIKFDEIYRKYQKKTDALVLRGDVPVEMVEMIGLVVKHFFTNLKKEKPEIFNDQNIGKSSINWIGGRMSVLDDEKKGTKTPVKEGRK